VSTSLLFACMQPVCSGENFHANNLSKSVPHVDD